MSAFACLTVRENQVIRLVALGLLNKQIAAELGTVLKAVKVHRALALAKSVEWCSKQTAACRH